MASETLVEALEKAGVGTYSADYRGMVARDADPIFKTLARFASPEAKREALAMLMKTQIAEWQGIAGGMIGMGRGNHEPYQFAIEHAMEALDFLLAPLEAP